ncbi:MAG: ABC transporter substrate-binding protein [Actinobacteria bacterium]|nr:ABC transporter substrate-binding protein [Actinomycetota bacterium]
MATLGNRAGRRALSRREFLRLGAGGLASAVLLGGVGCSGEGQSGMAPVRLTFSHGPDESGTFRQQVEEFNRLHAGEIEVRYREMPADTGQYYEQLRTEFQAGGGEIDVISGDVTWPARFAAQGWISDLSEFFTRGAREQYLPYTIESNTYEDAVYGVPWFTDAGMLYYRKDLLEDSGFSDPPGTWDELKEQARKVQRDSGTQYGFVFQGADYEGGVVNGLEYVWTSGGDVLDPRDPDEVVVGSEQALEGLRTEQSMVTDGVAPKAVSSYKELESYTVFGDGDAVFMRNWPFAYALSTDPTQSRIRPEQVGIVTLPVIAEGVRTYSGLGGWNLFINTASGNRDAAWTFIQYLSAPEQQRTRALRGSYLPTLETLYEDDEVLETVPILALGREAIQSARPRPSSPSYPEMSLKMSEQFNALVRGVSSPEQVTSTLQAEIANIVEQGGEPRSEVESIP